MSPMGSGNIIDDRHDALYCTLHANDSDTTKRCTGNYGNPDDHAWSVQVVTQITSWGSDSSALAPTTTTYHYRLASYGDYNGNSQGYCYPAGSSPYLPGQTDCTFDTWIPGASGTMDGDWKDYYHGEYRGFQVVYTTSPAGDLTADSYYSSEGWASPESNSGNYNAASLFEEDVYRGNSTSGPLLRKTFHQYTGNNGHNNACDGVLNNTYTPCEVLVLSSRTTFSEGTGSSSAPWVQSDNTYDDFSDSTGFTPSSGYHNLLQQVVSSSNAPTLTKKWSYTTNNQTVSGTTYYTVNKVTHSEIDDAGGHVWACQDTTYDEGVASGVPTPDAGWPTTVKVYSTCGTSSTAITTYSGYDAYGNPVASVDGVGTANSSLYTSSGCTLSTAPVYKSSSWSPTRYTGCITYDSYHAQPSGSTNALSQTGSLVYDYTQGSLPISVTDANSQVTTTSYSYDGSGNRTVSVKAPLESGSYTGQSSTLSNCTSSSTLPCFEIDSKASLYPNAITRTFYDSLGRAVETRSTGPDAGHDTVVFTAYNDAAHTVFTSVPFEVNSGSSWIDPNTAKDYNNVAPGGSVTYLDALGRPIASDDPLLGSSQEPGITCPAASGHHTACAAYGLGSANGDTATYAYAESLDSNNHASVSFVDALGRTRYTQEYSGLGLSSLSANIVQQKATQYNALNEPISVVTTDLAPQSGQTITSVIASATYDDLGRVTAMGDPDRGTHSYSYDADGRLLSDVSGTRTIGINYDLLGCTGCVQDATPTINATGACTSGTHPYMQNTYDTTFLGTKGTSDFPVGRLTQSVATTYYPGSTSATVTQQLQHDQRGRPITGTMQLTWPGSWGVTTPLPTYQVTTGYNNANQPTTTTTSTSPAGQGYTTTNVYDSTTGALVGLSNTGTATANVALLTFTPRAQINTITDYTTSGTGLSSEQYSYDANLRATGATATWLSGSGNSGTILSQSKTYDASSDVTSLSTTLAAVPGARGSGGSETQNFCYSEQNRLVWAGNSGTQPGAGNGTCGSGTLTNSLTGAGYSASYVYTHLGQVWQAPQSTSSTNSQYLYCDSSHPHQLTGLYSLGATCSTKTGQTYASSYDAWGNVTSRTVSSTSATLSYDGLDNLTMYNAGSNSQEQYVYDAGGNRILRRSTSSGTTMTVYAFGLEEHRYSGSGVNQGNTYYYSLGGMLVGESTSSGTNMFLTDALGSVLETISATANTAAVQGNQVYSPYGSSRYQQGSMGTAKGFTGQYNDSVSGLDYYGSRYYDPVVGRFLSADLLDGNLAGMDPYAYVGGNPETFSDPSGQRFVPPPGGGGDGGGAGGGGGGDGGGAGGGGSGNNPAVGFNLTHLVPPGSSGSSGNQQNCYGSLGGQGSGADCTKQNAHLNVRLTGFLNVLQEQQMDVGGILCSTASLGCVTLGLQTNIRTIQTIPVSFDSTLHFSFCFTSPAACAQLEGDTEGLTGGSESTDPGFPRAPEQETAAELTSADNTGGRCSFTPDTAVTTDHGQQTIGTLQVGERVLAYNPKTGKMEQEPILHVWINHDHDLVDLTITTTTKGEHGKAATKTSEVIHTNQKHPFFTIEHGFLPVVQIKLGMHLLRADGRVGVVTGWKVVPGTKTMYNLEVAQDHTFTVGTGQWVVHNKCFPNRLPERLPGELQTADALGVKPLKVTDEGFQEVIQNGTVKWAITEDGQLYVIPKWVDETEIAHTAITRGDPVLAAGEATIINTGNGYRVTSFGGWSGHYWPDEASEVIGRNAFIEAGIQFPPPIGW